MRRKDMIGTDRKMKGELKFNNLESPQTCRDSVSCCMHSKLLDRWGKTGCIIRNIIHMIR